MKIKKDLVLSEKDESKSQVVGLHLVSRYHSNVQALYFFFKKTAKQ